MKKEYRIKKNYEFQSIINNGKFKSNKSFVVYFSNAQLAHDRVGISVSKKLGNAVERNKYKRQVREMVKDIFNFSTGHDYIIICRKGFLNNDFTSNKKDLSAIYNLVYNKEDKL